MKSKRVKIGHSLGIQIPDRIPKNCGLQDAAAPLLENDQLVTTKGHRPRASWEKAFCSAGPSTYDELLHGTLLMNQFDRKDWQW
jgi:hypothetical protein